MYLSIITPWGTRIKHVYYIFLRRLLVLTHDSIMTHNLSLSWFYLCTKPLRQLDNNKNNSLVDKVTFNKK